MSFCKSVVTPLVETLGFTEGVKLLADSPHTTETNSFVYDLVAMPLDTVHSNATVIMAVGW